MRRFADPLDHSFGKGQEWDAVFVLNLVARLRDMWS
jgi:hypothetical protein